MPQTSCLPFSFRFLVVLGLLLGLTSSLRAQNKGKYFLPSPKGWRTEKIKLPPSFAPKMKLKGLEDIRFAPGMFKPKSDSFFSYVILFWLPGKEKVGQKELESNLLLYYKGLCKAVMGAKAKVVLFNAFQVKLKQTKRKTPLQRDGQAVTEYQGKLVWVEPFRTKKKQILNLEVQSWYCAPAKHYCVLICVSPKPKNAKIWQEMRKIRNGFRCGKKVKRD